MTYDGALCKVLLYSILFQLQQPGALASVDATNYYSRVVSHKSMVFQAFGTPTSACLAMLEPIQKMKLFLHMTFGDSKVSIRVRINLKTKGFVQGNKASPAGWVVASNTTIQAHRKEDHEATFPKRLQRFYIPTTLIWFISTWL